MSRRALQRRYGRAGYRIGSRGLERPKSIHLTPGHIYAMGASTSPDLIEVISVSDDSIHYRRHSKYGDTSAKGIARWIGEDLISQGEATFKERYGVSPQTWIHATEAERRALLKTVMPGLFVLRKRYGRSLDRPEPNEKHTVTGTVTYVYATGRDITIKDDSGKDWRTVMVAPNYWASGSTVRAFNAALRVQKWIGRRVVAELEYHPAFGWTIFGGSKIRLARGGA